jgi:hypothetical protein
MVSPRCVYKYNPNILNKAHQFEFIEEDGQTEWPHAFDKKLIFYDVIGLARTLPLRHLRRALNLATSTYDIEIDVVFKPLWADRTGRGANDITIDFKSSEEDQLFKDRPGVLAYAYFPGTSLQGVVVFNNDYIWSLDGKDITAQEAFDKGWIDDFVDPTNTLKTFNIIHVLIHELGHTLGLRHDEHDDSRDVMDAFYSGLLELSDWDILRLLLKYPRRIYRFWQQYARIKNAYKRIKLRYQD